MGAVQQKTPNVAETFINPAGFIEQHYKGYQSAPSVIAGIKKMKHCIQALQKQEKPALVLIDITQLTGTSAASRKAGLDGIKSVNYDKAAMYGPTWTQVLVNTLALVGGKSKTVKAFENRSQAIRWLKSKK